MKFFWILLFASLGVAALQAREPTHRLFVTNEEDNTVSVIDSRTHELVQNIEVGGRPRGIGFSPDRAHVYVALGDENAIGVIDTVTLKVLKKLPAGSDPEAFDVHPNGRIYLSNEDSGKATVINPDTGKIEAEIQVGIEPEGVAVTPDGKKVMVTSESTNMVHVITVPEHEIVANILVGARPREVAFSEDGRYAYVTCEVGGEVVKFDVETNKIVQRKKLRREIRLVKPKGIRRGPDGRFWVATGRGDLVAVLNADTLELEKQIPVGRRVWGMAFSADGKQLYVTNSLDGTLSLIDVAKAEEVKKIKTGGMPWGVILDD